MQGRFGPSATLFPLILIASLAGMTYWLDLASRAPTGASDGKTRHDPDYIVENFEVRRFDPEGALQHSLRAPLMRHFPDDDSTTVFSPNLTYHRVPPTHVSAREGQINSGATHVELIDEVRIIRGGSAGKPDSVLTTSHLDAYPDDEVATSKMPVTITQGQTIVTGSGLDANNKTQIYLLDGPVHGIFHRNPTLKPSTPAAAPPVAAPKKKPQARTPSKAQQKSKR